MATSRPPCLPWLATSLALLLTAAPNASHAAIRRCHKPIVTEGRDARSETEARRKAVSAWIEFAGAIGPGYTRFDLAIGRRVACEKQPDASHVCRAMGAPCTIEQNPRAPRGPGKGIDI